MMTVTSLLRMLVVVVAVLLPSCSCCAQTGPPSVLVQVQDTALQKVLRNLHCFDSF
jgi:hypothetical protein